MGRRGPPPIPTRILQMRNSWRAKVRPDEPRPLRGAPVCPAWLSPEAKAKWDEIVPLLDAARMLTKVDGQALVRYCDMWGRWLKAARFLDERGEIYPIKDGKGNVKMFMPWPQVSTYHKLAHGLLRLEQELGLSPASRTRVVALKDEPADDPRAEARRAFFRRGSASPLPAWSEPEGGDGDAEQRGKRKRRGRRADGSGG